MARDKVTEIRGMVRNTKDSASVDGECDEVLNMRFKDKSWRPVGTLKDVEGYGMLGSEGYERLFVHTNEYRHLFGVKGGNLYWIGNLDDSSVITPFLAGVTGAAYAAPQLVKEGVSLNMRICQTGHLMVVIDDGLSYYLYRPYADRYDRVITDYNNEIDGRLLPYGNVELKVDLECCEDGRPFIFSSHIGDAGIADAKGDMSKESEVMRDVINKTEKDITALNRFWGAFLACTAAELYDGTFILMSQPSLMLAPNVKSSDRYQNANVPFLTANGYTLRPSLVSVEYNHVNPDFCERIFHYVDTQNTPFDGQLTTADKCNDLRDGIVGIYQQMIGQKSQTFLFLDNSINDYNQVDYEYNHELINDSDFLAVAMDVYRGMTEARPGYQATGVYNTFVIAKNIKDEIPFHVVSDYSHDGTYCYHYANKLKYRITSAIPAEYKDVIKNISVFITPQAQTINLNKCVKSVAYKEYIDGVETDLGEMKYDYRTIANITKELMGEAMMYKIGEIKTGDFTEANVGKWVDLKMDDGVLTNLLSQERLVVDANGRDSYNAKVAFPYNNRLHIADYIEELFHGWLIDHFFYNEGVGQFADGVVGIIGQSGTDRVGWIKVTIDDDGTQKVVVREINVKDLAVGSQLQNNTKQIRYLNPVLSYPDKRAKSMEVYIHSNTNVYGVNNTFHETYTLTAHDFYDYAYYVTPDLKPIDTHLTSVGSVVAVPSEEKNKEAYHNRMKVSKMNNPLYFPYETVYSVGNGKIVGMAANEMVLATGQVGDAPLYVFCSDGVYGFFVDSSGMLAYGFARVLSEYVCNNGGGIFNIHGGVMFPTDKGYVLLEGLQARDVTEKIEGVPFFRKSGAVVESDIPQAGLVMENERLVRLTGCMTTEDFVEYIRGCVGGYNFAEKEVWICNKEKGYSYVVDREGMWTKRTDSGVQFVNDFPRTYLLDVNMQGTTKVSTLRNLLDERKDARQTMFLTRAIKNDTQEFKQTERLIMRGEYHLPESDEYDVQEIDLTNVYVAAETVEVREPRGVMRLQENAVVAYNDIVPLKVYHNNIAICDNESSEYIKDASNNNINVTDNDATFGAVKNLFRVGHLIQPTVGWKRIDASDADGVEYSISVNVLQTQGFDVRMRFGNKRVYKVQLNQTDWVDFYFMGGWEGTCDELGQILQGLTASRGGVCYRTNTNGVVANHGLYFYGYNATSGTTTFQDAIVESELNVNSNYRFAYINIDRSVTPYNRVMQEYDLYMSGVLTGDQDCYNFMVGDVLLNVNGYYTVAKYNNLVTVAAGNNRLYLDDRMQSSVTFSATAAQAGTGLQYGVVLNNYNSGVYGVAAVSSGVYFIPRNTYVRLYSSLGVYIKTIYYTSGSAATWVQLLGYPAVTLNGASTTIAFVNGGYYDIRIGYYDNGVTPAVYRSFNGVRKYIGVSGSMSLSAIYADVMSATPVSFAEVTESDHLAAHNVSLRNGVYYRVTYKSGGVDVTVEIRGTADEIISGATLVTRIGQGYYPQWAAVDKLAGLYLFGSYDNKKWALIGARERGGDFRDLGLVAYRTDCKYFRLLFVAQLKSGSSIEYIEQVVSDRVFRAKIR